MKTYQKIVYAFLLLQPAYVPAQDTAAIFAQLHTSLEQHKTTVSDILINEGYMKFHSQKTFREIIKKFAPVGKIAIISPAEPGRKITIVCEVKTNIGKPFADAMAYVYQTSAKGWYSDTAPHILQYEGDYRYARLFGYVRTDKEGKFEIKTIMPSGYPKSDLPAHIHIELRKDDNYVSGVPGELQFEEDERMNPERKKRSLRDGFLIAGNSGTEKEPLYKYRFTIHN